MIAAPEVQEELREAEALLRGGEWVDGGAVVAAIFRQVTPQRALRIGLGALHGKQKGGEQRLLDTEEGRKRLMDVGRAYRAYRAIDTRLKSGVWECRPARFRMLHVHGEYPFQLRSVSLADNGLTLADMSERLGIATRTLEEWPKRGYVPRMVTHVSTGVLYVQPGDVEWWVKVALLFVKPEDRLNGRGKPRRNGMWRSDPREVWLFRCPHCGRSRSEPPDPGGADDAADTAAPPD